MFDAVLTWSASPSSNVNQYFVQWTLNGTNVGTSTVQQSAALDASGYSTGFDAANPTSTLKSGDVVGATITAVDTVDVPNLSSAPITPTPVTVPATPTAPQPPTNVALALK